MREDEDGRRREERSSYIHAALKMGPVDLNGTEITPALCLGHAAVIAFVGTYDELEIPCLMT